MVWGELASPQPAFPGDVGWRHRPPRAGVLGSAQAPVECGALRRSSCSHTPRGRSQCWVFLTSHSAGP